MAQSKNRVAVVLEMIKFEHSVFALPFALVGALLAARAGRHVADLAADFVDRGRHGWSALRGDDHEPDCRR